MCGRYVLFLKLSQVHQRLLDAGLRVDSTVPDNETRPSYNISPSSFEPVYYATPGDGTKEQKYRLEPMKWGLTVPNTHITAINLRTESLTAKPPSWKSHLRSHRRCIIPANGFYEWLSSGSTKIPYYTKLAVGEGIEGFESVEGVKDIKATTSNSEASMGSKNELLFFAGLYDISPRPAANNNVSEQGISNEVLTSSDQTSSTQTPQAPTRTFTILTTTSNPHLQFLHDRMPVILTASQVPLWLDTNKSWSPELEALLKPYEGELVTYQVTQEVGKVGNSEPGFIVPVKERKDGIMEAFKKQAVGGKKSEVEKKGGEGKEEEEDAVKEVERFLENEKREGLDTSTTPQTLQMTEESTATGQNSKPVDWLLSNTPTNVADEPTGEMVVMQEAELDPVKEVEEYLAKEAQKQSLRNRSTTPKIIRRPATQMLSPSQKFIPTLKSVSTAMEGFVSNSPTKVKDKSKTGEKRSAEDAGNEEKKVRRLPHRRTRRMKSAISNADQRRVKQTKNDGNVKITNFFESK